MSRRCAYCGESGPLTREHVVPDFLYRDHPDQKLGYNQNAKKFLTFEAIVRDVCSSCNSGVLSSLDAYGQEFVRENRCDRTFTKRPTLLIRYEHELLLRWLLKLSYNAVRFAGRDPGLLASCTGYVRGVGPLPHQATLLVEVVRDAVLAEELPYSSPDASGVTNRLSAQRFRFGEARTLEGARLSGQCRLIALNAFYFYIILLPPPAGHAGGISPFRALRDIAPQAVRLPPGKRGVRVRVAKRTIVDAYRHQAEEDLPAWLDYLSSAGA